MSDQRTYLRKVKALAADVHVQATKKNADPGTNAYKLIIELTDMKWYRFCRKNKKANPNAFKEYMQLCQ